LRGEIYIERLTLAVNHLHGCDSKHIESVPVEEVYEGKTVWQGIVEVFEVRGHPKANKVYAWSHVHGKNDDDERFVAVLGLPPVTSPETAVKVAIAGEVRAAQRKRAKIP
jgi:hypothetical protein